MRPGGALGSRAIRGRRTGNVQQRGVGLLVVGVILAGGRGQRLGGADKALVPLAGRPLLAHAIARLAPQTDRLALSANGEAARFAAFGLPVLADPVAGFPGPLGGILAGLDWAASLGAGFLVSAAVDTPFFPGDLVPRLIVASQAAGDAGAIAATPAGAHPTFGLWPVQLRAALRQDLAAGQRRVLQFAQRRGMATAGFPATEPDGFFNINTPDDLAQAEALLGMPS